MASNQELTGPDLSAGIEQSALLEGQMLVGHAAGEAVLIARSGAKVFAIGAHCTHYGGPLADGILVGDSVRCPYHHACFSLETGAATRAPARDAVACYEILEQGDKLYVLGKRAASDPAPIFVPESVLIVGAGAAGNSAAEKLRREGYRGQITLVGAEPFLPVDRPNLSKDYLAGTAPEEWIPLRSPEFYAEQQISVLLDTRVRSFDPKAKLAQLSNGTTLAYGALLLATGASPILPDLPGITLPHVFTLRTLADSRAIIEKSARIKHAVLIGAGFIGLEAAASLRARNVEVTVVAPEALPLGRVLGEALGKAVRKLHEAHGVQFQLGRRPVSISEQAVTLDDGTVLAADLVIVGIGVKPELGLAEAAGLAVDRGVVVDQYLRTSAPGVYAAGDIARFPDASSSENIRVEHWVVATRQGETAALNILGKAQPFSAVPFFWSAHYDCTISCVGHAEAWDRVDIAGSVEALDCAVAFRKSGKTLAVASIGRDQVSLQAEAALERRDEAALHRLIPA
jgi:NADPH-dependent 2,4-dienoyl-CoA reductase/sulfur reductase-like enzyme/nitrite reductase/ring-hydroxylating ferredoxin subunit